MRYNSFADVSLLHGTDVSSSDGRIFSFALSTFTKQAGSSGNTVLYCNIVCSVHSVDVS